MTTKTATPTAAFRGGAGTEWTFDLPLPWHLNVQVRKGDLVPADEAARTYADGITDAMCDSHPRADVTIKGQR